MECACLALVDDFDELGQKDDNVGPVAVIHARLDVRWFVDHAEEFDLFAFAFHDLGYFESEGCAIRISGNGIRAFWLNSLNLTVVCRYTC